ncbi:MAG: DUF2018 family protein [Sulfuricurvum sp.]
MSYEALFEDENDIFAGTPQSKYWDIASQVSDEIFHYEFDRIVQRMAAMERLLMEHYDEEMLSRVIDNHCLEHFSEIEMHKKSLYMELAGDLIYKMAD